LVIRLSVVPGLFSRERTSRGVHDRKSLSADRYDSTYCILYWYTPYLYDGSIFVGVILFVRIGPHMPFWTMSGGRPETTISRISREDHAWIPIRFNYISTVSREIAGGCGAHHHQ